MLTYPCMLRFPDRPDALPLNPIWNFETTSRQNLQNYSDLPISVPLSLFYLDSMLKNPFLFAVGDWCLAALIWRVAKKKSKKSCKSCLKKKPLRTLRARVSYANPAGRDASTGVRYISHRDRRDHREKNCLGKITMAPPQYAGFHVLI